MKNKNLILLDLFSGIGGFHKGLVDAGFDFKHIYYSEIDKHAIANYKYNYPNAEHIGSVTTILQSGIPRPNIITFGSPCQDFSLAGNREGLAGNKSSLIKEAIAAISHFRPDLFIWENVKGTFSSNSRRDFWAIIKAFADIGNYAIEWQLVNTSWLLPQNRERIYLVGHLTTSFRDWKGIFPIGEDEELSVKQNKAGKRQSQTENCATIKVGYGGKADDTYIITRGHGFVKSNINDICPTIRKGSFEHNLAVVQSKPVNKINIACNIYNGQDGIVVFDNGLCPTVSAGHFNTPKVLVNSANKKGYEEAEDGDSINLQYPKSKTRRGRVGKRVAQTLDCNCNQAVIQLNPSTESNGRQPYQQNRIYDTNGISPAIPTDSRSPIVKAVLTPDRAEKRQNGRRMKEEGEPSFTLTSQDIHGVMLDNDIRRLTEIECERLQGFPDNWTKIGNYNGVIKDISKTQRYKMLGNAVTAKKVQFIGSRIITNYN